MINSQVFWLVGDRIIIKLAEYLFTPNVCNHFQILKIFISNFRIDGGFEFINQTDTKMGKAIYLIVIMAFIAGCQGKTEKEENQDTDQEMVVAPENVELVSIDIEGMTCTGCENTIEGGISELEGIVEVTASHVDGNATVKYDKSRASIEQMKGAIEKKGYTVVGHETILE